jgi:tRNA/tmRNA/rRNA uracil-C5-methylase (TrmA/RlmC/RlmD family)
VPAERATLTIERPVHGGYCLASLPSGQRVLVAGVIPGERVDATVEVRKGVAFAVVDAILAASPDRVEPPAHPGLDLGHVALPLQLAWKREVLADAARRVGVTLPAPLALPVPSPASWGYRASVQPAVVASAGAGSELGYRRPGSHELVALERDPTANAACDHAWSLLRQRRLPKGVREVVIRGNEAGEVLLTFIAVVDGKRLLPLAHDLVAAGIHGVALAPFDPRGRFRGGAERLAGARSLEQRYGSVTVSLSPGSFGQPNPAAAAGLFAELAAWAPPARHALDLYGGHGVIGMHLAARSERVTVIDIDRSAIERGRIDAARAGLEQVHHVRLDARDLRVPDDIDLIAVDPPRAGLAAATRAEIAASRARTLMMVSCDVATWVRDVADLLQRGFVLERVQAFDFQPHTHHLEILSRLRRRGW